MKRASGVQYLTLVLAPIVILIMASALAQQAPSNPACKANGLVPEGLMTPLGIKSYLENNSHTIKSIEDFVCCLPKSYRQSYIMAHSSKSAQKSRFTSPRVLIFTPVRENEGTKRLQPLSLVLSINGGESDLDQSMSIEMMYDNKRSRELEFFDIANKDGKFHFSEKNPVDCMICHGDGEKAGPYGPKTIFNPVAEWPRFFKGISPCTESEKKLIAAMERASKTAFRGNPRFRCLDPKPDGVDPFKVNTESGPNPVRPAFKILDFDESMAELNERRVARLLKETPDYDKYKFVIAGAVANCIRSGTDLTSWLPLGVLKRHDSTNYLNPALRNSTDLQSAVITGLKQFETADKKLSMEQLRMAKEIEAGGTPYIEFSTRPTACMTKRELDFRFDEFIRNLSGPREVARFYGDTLLKGFRKTQGDPILRFLMEGRGISMHEWAMTPTPDEPDRPFRFILQHLVAAEPVNSKLRSLESDMKRSVILAPGASGPLDGSLRQAVCNRLRELSNKAFDVEIEGSKRSSKTVR